MALTEKKKKQVEKLLKEGKLSKRAIHRETGVSRITIDKMEKRLLYPEKEQASPPPKAKLDREAPAKMTSCNFCKRKLLENTPCLFCHIYRKQIEDYNTFIENLLTPGR